MLEHEAARSNAPFESAEDVRSFFEHVDRTLDPQPAEPDWEEHRRVLDASRGRSSRSTPGCRPAT